MEPAKTFEDLIVRQKAHQFTFDVYKCTSSFPKAEMVSLSNQFRRAAVLVGANIADGFRKDGIRDKLRFLNIAQASLDECIYYLRLSKDLGYGVNTHLKLLAEEVSRILNAYYRGLEKHLQA